MSTTNEPLELIEWGPAALGRFRTAIVELQSQCPDFKNVGIEWHSGRTMFGDKLLADWRVDDLVCEVWFAKQRCEPVEETTTMNLRFHPQEAPRFPLAPKAIFNLHENLGPGMRLLLAPISEPLAGVRILGVGLQVPTASINGPCLFRSLSALLLGVRVVLHKDCRSDYWAHYLNVLSESGPRLHEWSAD